MDQEKIELTFETPAAPAVALETAAPQDVYKRQALKHGVQPRCEINSADEAKYYIDLGVRHFCIGDELRNNMTYWNNVGGALKEIVDTL